ncbi:girdin-like [Leptopilina heterotoma]|uniref:girdin-like n=1 Tax=Leptopilina heterotoma TaxID=63436 RepID=UPI001CA941A9|nr:girdin-like [Leptopilina heterotoma]
MSVAYVLILGGTGGTKIKKKVPIKSIKKFSAEKHVPNQKYKLEGEPQTECIILFMAENEKELDLIIQNHRPRQLSNKLLHSAAETTDDEKKPSNTSRKRQATQEKIHQTVKKRLENLKTKNNNRLLAKSDIIHISEKEPLYQDNTSGEHNMINVSSNIKTNVTNIENVQNKIESLEKQNAFFFEEINMLKDSLLKKDHDLSTKENVINFLDDEVQRRVEELSNLRKLNMEWQKTGLDKYKTLLEVHKATVEKSSAPQEGSKYPAIGFITEDET